MSLIEIEPLLVSCRKVRFAKFDYRDIYSPTPDGWVLWRKSNRVAISVHCKPLRIWIEVSAAVERMHVNNSNCNS